MTTGSRRQSGMALIVGLILLSLMTVMVITSFNIGRTSLDIVSNMQRRVEIVDAANAALQEVISSDRLYKQPGNIFIDPCDGDANTRCVDVNGDDNNDITVVLDPEPTCVQAQIIPNSALDVANATSRPCLRGVAQVFGIQGAASGNSQCANSVWEIRAVATDEISEAEVAVTQGTAIRVSTDDLEDSCPCPTGMTCP